MTFDEIFAVTTPGLESVCARELGAIVKGELFLEKGGVSFSGTLEDLYRANLGSAVASRILVRAGEVRATDFPELYRKVKRLPWGRFIRPERSVTVRCTSRKSRLNHTGRMAEVITDAINGALGRAVTPFSETPQLINARIERDLCTLSVDSSGDRLHRRGYRSDVSQAPLRETLAAGILGLLDWHGQKPLYDPMCGSGTFLVEGCLVAAGKAPGLQREFAFHHWPRYRDGLWKNLLLEAERGIGQPSVSIRGSDSDPDVVAAARRNVSRAGFSEVIEVDHCDIDQVRSRAGDGLVICNPPYGIRLGDEKKLGELYRRLGKIYSGQFAGWQGALFCPSEKLVAETGLEFRVVGELTNGGVPTRLFICDL